MTKINPDKSTSLKFKIALQGAKEAPQARLIIQPEGSSHFIGIPADINEDMITIKIPARYEHFTFTEASARLEVIVGQDYFVPWRDEFIIEESFKLEVTPLTEVKEEEKHRVSVTIVEEEVEKPKPVQEKVAEPVIPPAPQKKEEPVEEDCGKKHKKVKEETDEDDETIKGEKEAAKIKKKAKEQEAPALKEKVEPHRKLTGYL